MNVLLKTTGITLAIAVAPLSAASADAHARTGPMPSNDSNGSSADAPSQSRAAYGALAPPGAPSSAPAGSVCVKAPPR